MTNGECFEFSLYSFLAFGGQYIRATPCMEGIGHFTKLFTMNINLKTRYAIGLIVLHLQVPRPLESILDWRVRVDTDCRTM
jgi:hypothetical protein